MSATMPHPDRLMTRERPTGPPEDVDLAVRVENLALLMAREHGGALEALEALARAAGRLARARRRGLAIEDERPFAVMGQWSLDNGLVSSNIILGEN